MDESYGVKNCAKTSITVLQFCKILFIFHLNVKGKNLVFIIKKRLRALGIERVKNITYLAGRTQQVSVNGSLSDKFNLTCRVPQGSCLGPLLFTIYASSLFDILKSHLPSVHTYADDTQLYISFNPVDKTSEADAVIAIENCIHDVRAWMRDDKLILNDDKT